MGVVYKLLPEVSSFIIEQKQGDPKATCKNLAGRVFLKFGHPVSKSSVHELLKQSGIITPRVRKATESFKIPDEKKAEISKALQGLVSPQGSLSQEQASAEAPSTDIFQKKTLQRTQEPLAKTKVFANAGEVFLKAAFWDLSFKPVLGIADPADLSSLQSINLRFEWEYLTQLVYAIKVEVQGDQCFYLDGRLQGVHAQNPKAEQLAAPIERVAAEVADNFLNEAQPLLVRRLDAKEPPEALDAFIAAFENESEAVIKKISLLGARDQVFAEFDWPQNQKRQFMIGIPHNHKHFQWVIEDPRPEAPWQPATQRADGKSSLKVLKKGSLIIATNCISMSYEEITRDYEERHPGEQRLSVVRHDLKEEVPDAPLWLRNRLKERALMFFPSPFSINALDQVLGLRGFEASNERSLELHLEIPATFEFAAQAKEAAQNINNISISDFRARKLKVFIY